MARSLKDIPKPGNDPLWLTAWENFKKLKWIPSIQVIIQEFGALGDGVHDDTSAIQAALDYVHTLGGGVVIFPVGTYFISSSLTVYSNTIVQGAGMGAAIVDLKTNYNTKAFKTPTPTITALTQTSSIAVGDLSNTMTSPGALAVWDILYYENSTRFTAEWDGGSAIRAYYTNKEIFRVKSVSGTTITFDEAAALAQAVGTAVACSYFTPNKNIKISDLTIQRDADSSAARTDSMGISLEYCDGARVENVEILRSNSAGIQAYFSTDISIENVRTTGSCDSNSGTNYGILNNGSKHVNIKHTWHRHHRHGITAGTGTGTPIPMYQSASDIHVNDSMTTASFDCHGGSLGFQYSHCFGDQGMSISGIGHSMADFRCLSGVLELYEGGADLYLENIFFQKCNRHYSNNIVYRAKFVNVTFNYGAVGSGNGFSSTGLNASSKFIEYHRCKFWNRAFMDASMANNAAADATITGTWTEPGTGGSTLTGDVNNSFGMQLYEGYQIIDCEIHGFPTGYRIIGPNCTVRNIRVINCAWDTAVASAAPGVFSLNSVASGSMVDDVIVEFYKSGPTNAQNVFFFSTGGGGSKANMWVSNVRYGVNHTSNYNQGVSLPAGFSSIFLLFIDTTCTVADTLTPTTGCLFLRVNGLIYKDQNLFHINSSGQFVLAARMLSTLTVDGNFTVGSSKFVVSASTGATDIASDVTADTSSSGQHRFRKAIAASGASKVFGAESTGNTNKPRLEIWLREDTKDVSLRMNGSVTPNSIIIEDSSGNALATFPHAGGIAINTTGKSLSIKEGSNAKMGVSTLTAGTVTVSTTAVLTASRILLQRRAINASTALGELQASAADITNATSFKINALTLLGVLETGDASDVLWVILDPA